MIACYVAPDAQEAHLLVLALHAAGVPARADANYTASAWGDAPGDVLQVRVCVPADRAEDARAVLERHFAERREPEGAPWTCPSCGERNGARFDVCWRCQTFAPPAD